MPSQVQTRMHHVDALTGDGEIGGHKVGVIAARRNESVDLLAVCPNQVQALAALGLGQRLQVNVVHLKAAQNGNAQAPLDFVYHSREQGTGQVDDVRTHIRGQPVEEFVDL